MAMKWIRKAQENGAIIIHVDPRYTRTSATADIFARIRPGADVAFLGAMINYVLENKLYDEDYVDDAHERLAPRRRGLRLQDGLFSGFDEEKHKYDTKTWGYQLDDGGKPKIAAEPRRSGLHLRAAAQVLLALHARDGRARSRASRPRRSSRSPRRWRRTGPGTILYALGMTQHTTGVQGIRAFTILQLLLGNIGKPGGGVNALRGEPNVQGACDMGVLNNYMPGYLNYPSTREPTLAAWTENNGTSRRRLMVNMLKAFFGDDATPENDFGYAWLPKRNAAKDYSIFGIFESALAGTMKMLWVVGQNPAVTLAQPADRARGDGRSSRCSSCRRSGRPRRRRSGSGRASIRRRSRPRCSCCRPRSSWRRTARSRTRARWCSGATPR